MASRLRTVLFRNQLIEPDVRGKIIVVYNRRDTLWGWLSMKQGLFSEFFSVLGALKYARQNGAAGVAVRFDSDLYLDPAHGGNWWAYFFEPVMRISAETGPAPEIHFSRRLCRFGPHGWNLSWSSVILPPYPPESPYPLGAGDVMKQVADLVAGHIRVKPAVLDKVAAFKAQHFGDDFVIGIHYRGTDKKLLYPYQSPSYALFKAYIHRVLARFAPDSYKLFVATDETEFIEWATATFPGKVLSYEDSPRLSARDPLATKGGTHKSRCFSNFQKGESAVLDCLLLAACSYLIKNRSSFSDISLAFNPKLPWTMIVGPDDPVYSTDPDV